MIYKEKSKLIDVQRQQIYELKHKVDKLVDSI